MEEQNFKETIKEISKLVRKNHFNYSQIKYIFHQVRKQCGLRSFKCNRGMKEHLSEEEFKNLLEFAYNQKTDYGLMLKVLLFTGARIDEFVNIEMKDVYLAEGKIYLGKTKGDRPRFVPLFNFYVSELRMYMEKENRSEGYLFESNRHNKYTTRRIQQIVVGLIKDAGITKRITPHRFRATIATWLSEKGVPTEKIQQMLGHTKLETTQIYTKGAVQDLTQIGNRLLSEQK